MSVLTRLPQRPGATKRSPELASRSLLVDALGRFRQNRAGLIGGSLLALLLVIAMFAGTLAPYDPLSTMPIEALQGPSLRHPMGTDEIGRDILSRVMYGARLSLRMGIVASVIAASLGLVFGLLAGYAGGRVDTVAMRLVDIALALPSQLTALALVAALGPNLTTVMVAVGLSGVARFTRLSRASTLSAREEMYVEAARSVGCSNRRIVFRHLLPNVFTPTLILATVFVSWAILLAAGLSFLGMGVQPPTPEWGLMLSKGRRFLRNAWWITFFPGSAIALTVLAINMVGDALRDVLDPRLMTKV
jgi:peptide/nickel transport system permease protein